MKYPTYLLFIFTIILTAWLSHSQEQAKLIFVQELFRHGVRYPINPSDIDNSSYAITEKKIGQLSVEGKAMHYYLGKQMYKQYWQKLFGKNASKEYNNSKFYIKSTDVNRTIQSAQSHILGLFQNLTPLNLTQSQANYSSPSWPNVTVPPGILFENASSYQPVVIHSEKIGSDFNWRGDFLRAFAPENCPNQQKWQEQNHQSQFVKKVYNNEKMVDAKNKLSDALHIPLTFSDVGKYFDNYMCALYLGKEHPKIFDDKNFNSTFNYMYILDMYMNLFLTKQQIKATSFGFFEATINNIKKVMNNMKPDVQDIPGVQWVIYSAHDTTMGNVLAGLGLTSAKCIYNVFESGNDSYLNDTCIAEYPRFSSNIIFEVYNDATFIIKYNGKERKIPFCNNNTVCNLSQLYTWFDKQIKIDSYASSCGLYNEDKQFYMSAFFLCIGIIIACLLYWIIGQLKKPKTQNKAPKQSSDKGGKKEKQMKEVLSPLVENVERDEIV